MVDNKKEIEKAKQDAWDNYEHEIGNLYSTSFMNGFELGVKWQKENISNSIEKTINAICKDNTHLLDTPEIQEIIKYFKK
jgi:hypothetical protein